MCQGGVALGYQCHHGTRLEHNIEVEVELELELELDFENDFQTEADAKFDKISLLSAEACTCDSGISFTCNTNSLGVNEFINVCVRSTAIEMEINYLDSLKMVQVTSCDVRKIVIVMVMVSIQHVSKGKDGISKTLRLSTESEIIIERGGIPCRCRSKSSRDRERLLELPGTTRTCANN